MNKWINSQVDILSEFVELLPDNSIRMKKNQRIVIPLELKKNGIYEKVLINIPENILNLNSSNTCSYRLASEEEKEKIKFLLKDLYPNLEVAE